MKFAVELDYTLNFGDLAPYFDGLRVGKAMASTCRGCGFVAFPARVLCSACGASALKWKLLSGNADILFRTEAGPLRYALVHFKGADTKSTVKLMAPDQKGSTGTLVATGESPPALWLDVTKPRVKETE